MVTMTSRKILKAVAPKEYVEQTALVQWLRLHPKLKNFFIKNDNEGKRSPVQGARVKSMGLRPGASDLFIAWPTPSYCGLWLEIKRDKKYTFSERKTDTWIAQEKFIEDMKSVGYDAKMCYGWCDGVRIIEDYLLT